MSAVWVVEDDAALSAVMEDVLAGAGYAVEVFPSAELACEAARERVPRLVFLDINLPGRSGLEALPDLRALEPPPEVVVVTAEPTAENAMDALALGAAHHLTKPLEPAKIRALARDLLGAQTPEPVQDLAPRLVGSSAAMVAVGRRIGALARAEVTVLIRGESGTGKELVARAIHLRSARAERPFKGVSCAAFPESLLEAELFGHERGAFTGAERARAGWIEEAEGGTLFLDEIGELSPTGQAKLLRFLEERSYARVGATRLRRADVRILAATHAPLEDRIESGEFREDLYYRLAVTQVELPPLRDRPDDIPALVEHSLARLGRPGVRVPGEVMRWIMAQPWPGNVRQLHNRIAAALVEATSELSLEGLGARAAAQDESISEDHPELRALLRRWVARANAGDPDYSQVYARAKAALERGLIAEALLATDNNQVAASKLLDLNRATLRRKL